MSKENVHIEYAQAEMKYVNDAMDAHLDKLIFGLYRQVYLDDVFILGSDGTFTEWDGKKLLAIPTHLIKGNRKVGDKFDFQNRNLYIVDKWAAADCYICKPSYLNSILYILLSKIYYKLVRFKVCVNRTIDVWKSF